MVIEQNLRPDTCLLKGRSQVFRDERVLLWRKHHHAGRVLRIQRLVLDCDRVNRDPLGAYRLNVFHEIICKRAVIVRLEFSALNIIVRLHPGRSGPRRTQDLDSRLNRQNLLQHRNHIRAVRPQAELCHIHVGLARRQIIVGVDPLIHVGRADADAQVADADSAGSGGKQCFQQGRPGRSFHTHQQLRTSSRQRKAKALHGLEALRIVHCKNRQLARV